MGKSWLCLNWAPPGCLQALAPGHLCKTLASVQLFPFCPSSCVPPCGNQAKGVEGWGTLRSFLRRAPCAVGHVAKVYHFTWSFCLPGFTLNNTTAFGACPHCLKAGLPFHVDNTMASPTAEAYLPQHAEPLWPSTPDWLAQHLWPTGCPPASSGMPIKLLHVLKAEGDGPHCLPILWITKQETVGKIAGQNG